MNEYLWSIIGTILLSSLLIVILPEGKTKGLIQAIVRLACVLTIVSPVLRYFQSGNTSFFEEKNSSPFFSESVIQAEKTFIKYYSDMRVRETESFLKNEISEKFEANTVISLKYEMQDDKIKIVEICVQFQEEVSAENREKIEEYLMKNYCKEVLIE